MKELAKRGFTVEEFPVNADGITNVGFWLSATGCRSVTLKAFLVGVTAAKPITEVLPFACYE